MRNEEWRWKSIAGFLLIELEEVGKLMRKVSISSVNSDLSRGDKSEFELGIRNEE